MSATTATVDLGKSRCRLVVHGPAAASRSGVGAPGLAAAGGVDAALAAILPLLDGVERVDALGVGAAGAWFAPESAAALATALASRTGARVAVASDVVTAHVGALAGDTGVLLIAGTGAVALGVDAEGARLVDGWGPELGDLGSGSWLGREALRAILRAADGLAGPTALTTALAEPVGTPADVQAWLAADCALARRLATLAPLVLAAAEAGDAAASAIVAEAVRLLATTATAASDSTVDVALHGGLTDHPGFRRTLAQALETRGRRIVPARGDAMDGALLLTRRLDLPHERFVHRAE
ncbi:BadF/BadG/BcrA/BcrD ATPase family protein [Microbacterium sp. BLY]|uniref:N-acetylglucosamine kinase n=1 Tax=Microbacterium sp. BLY TaxID=2823280 RepID=UPI001B32673F|nr:BadF/BadG/BcrA/BcrD ATPase family protein [Microbacterium sp. BLY]MBP3977769.1 ATPase [Microbacterium sp. BLY]